MAFVPPARPHVRAQDHGDAADGAPLGGVDVAGAGGLWRAPVSRSSK